MLIGLDFDGVILDYEDVDDYWKIDVFEFKPVSEGVIELLNENKVGLILTGREDLLPVLLWVAKYAPGYCGEINSAESFGGSKGLYCKWRGVDLFVDDSDKWCDDIRRWGVKVLQFSKERFGCPKRMLMFFGYL